MPLDFNTPVCQHYKHIGQAIPAVFRLEHTKHGVTYLCGYHPYDVFRLVEKHHYSLTSINQHTQSAQEQHVDR